MVKCKYYDICKEKDFAGEEKSWCSNLDDLINSGGICTNFEVFQEKEKQIHVKILEEANERIARSSDTIIKEKIIYDNSEISELFERENGINISIIREFIETTKRIFNSIDFKALISIKDNKDERLAKLEEYNIRIAQEIDKEERTISIYEHIKTYREFYKDMIKISKGERWY